MEDPSQGTLIIGSLSSHNYGQRHRRKVRFKLSNFFRVVQFYKCRRSKFRKRRIISRRRKGYRSPNLWTSQSCFLSSKGFSECKHLFIDKPMVITEPTVTSTRLLGLGLRLYLSNMQRMLTKVFLGSPKRKALRQGDVKLVISRPRLFKRWIALSIG